MRKANPSNIEKVIRHLTENIGVRLGGSEKELEAARYMQTEFLKHLSFCTLESFPVNERCVERETLEIFINGNWKTYGASLLGSAPTTNGVPMEADLVFFDSHTDYQREDLSYLTGKAVIHYGVHIPDVNHYRRLMEAKPAFLLMVDTRHPSNLPLADGLFPNYVEAYGAVPSMNVACFDSWEWIRSRASRARLTISGCVRISDSHNVIAEIPGTDPDGRIIYAGAHLDTQANCPGADDNAAACANMLELARIFSGTSHRRTIRLIAFGTEEQLSVGSCAYLNRHAKEAENGGFMCNFDECGTAIGWTQLTVNTTPAGRKLLETFFHRHDIYYTENRIPQPYNDLFPFTAYGIGGFTCRRNNNEITIDYHHRADDTIDKVSPEIIAVHLDAVAELMDFLANVPDITPYLGLDAQHADEVQARWKETFL